MSWLAENSNPPLWGSFPLPIQIPRAPKSVFDPQTLENEIEPKIARVGILLFENRAWKVFDDVKILVGATPRRIGDTKSYFEPKC